MSGQPASSPLDGRGRTPHTNVPTAAYARLAYACNAGMDNDEMPGFTCEDAADAIEAGIVLRRLRSGLSDASELSGLEPWEHAIIEALRKYWASYGAGVMADVRADNRGLCLVLGMAMRLTLRSHEQEQRSLDSGNGSDASRTVITKVCPSIEGVDVLLSGLADARYIRRVLEAHGGSAVIEARGTDAGSPHTVHVRGLTLERVVMLLTADRGCRWRESPRSEMAVL